MTGPPPGRDDARPIPQRVGRHSAEDVEGTAGVDGLPDAGGDDIYTVDVRGRRARRHGSVPPGPAAPQGGRRPAGRPGGPAADVRVRRDQERPRGTRRGRFAAGRVVLLAVVAWLAFMVVTPVHAWSTVTKVDTTPAGSRPAHTKGFTYLLVGSDSREGLTAAQRKQYATGNAAGRRTDSIILVHVSQSGGKPALVSIPRDSYVPIPGHGSNKINAAFALGGPKLLVRTVEQVTDLHIDGYVEIGFAGFADVVDSVDGVTICVPFRMNDKKAGINLQKGCQVLDGRNALGFVRARYSDPRGDIGRAERQRQFLAAIMKKALTPATVLLPWRYWAFTHAAAHGLVVGGDTSLRDASRVLLTMRAVSKDQGLSLVVPIQSLSYQTSAGSSVKWDSERARLLFRSLRNDTPLEAPPAGTDGKPSGG
ncbi:LCP family protein [Pedococcus sp. 5OH_020]|uniref:LCP family protein n=1 Tax=Pedococcus sp. 5OH_020 TaxID=2989814 RepID=UPI0022E9DDB3|nr:LCP family protein [Pedococcus sp. 5OH_020]